MIGARDQLLQADLRRATTLSARHRMLFLLLTLLHRTRAGGEVDGDGFELPLNQARSGDLLGLTNVSVSKAMVELERDGTIERRRRHVTLLDAARSASQVGFVDRFAELDTSWFPGGAPDPDRRLVVRVGEGRCLRRTAFADPATATRFTGSSREPCQSSSRGDRPRQPRSRLPR